MGSRVTLYRILLNLLGNAVKFTPKGSISICAELSKKSTPDKAIIKLAITDTGIGIPADKQRLIFERFARVTPSYQGVYEGNGIGLYIVKEFVKSIGGEIYVKSEEDKGSRFMIAVPLQVPLLTDSEYEVENDFLPTISQIELAQSEISYNTNLSPIALTLSPQQKILLVEDNLIAQKAATTVLNSLGYEVDIANCGAQAIKLFTPGKYVLVFMDIGLPDMKGYQVTEHLREMEKETAFHVPILGLSAHATLEEKQLSASAGIDEIYSKPLLSDKATALLKQYVIAGNGAVKQLTENSSLFAKVDGLRIIDLQKKPGNSNLDEQLSWELLDSLIASLLKFRAEAEQAYNAQDMKLLLNSVHKFHGSVCYSKTPHLLYVVLMLEKSLKQGEHLQTATLYQDLLKAIDTLEKTYQLIL